MLRVYLDNQLFTYLRLDSHRVPNHFAATVEALGEVTSLPDVELLVSEESLAEIHKLPNSSANRSHLQGIYTALKAGKTVIRNSGVCWDDPIATWDSLDAMWDHPHDNTDLDRVRSFLASVGNTNDFDARYVANAMLPENRIDVFLTADKGIWRHREEIRERFGVTVMTPVELVERLRREVRPL